MCGTRRGVRSVVCDLVAGLLRHMDDKHATTVTPSLRPADAEMERRPFCDPENFSSGYIMRSQDILFKQGSREPWAHMLEYHPERETLPNADLDGSPSTAEPASHPEPMTRPGPANSSPGKRFRSARRKTCQLLPSCAGAGPEG